MFTIQQVPTTSLKHEIETLISNHEIYRLFAETGLTEFEGVGFGFQFKDKSYIFDLCSDEKLERAIRHNNLWAEHKLWCNSVEDIIGKSATDVLAFNTVPISYKKYVWDDDSCDYIEQCFILIPDPLPPTSPEFIDC